MKKTSRFVLALVILVGLLSSSFIGVYSIAASYDTTPPVLHDVQVDKATVETPGVVTVTFNVTDDLSGVSTQLSETLTPIGIILSVATMGIGMKARCNGSTRKTHLGEKYLSAHMTRLDSLICNMFT